MKLPKLQEVYVWISQLSKRKKIMFYFAVFFLSAAFIDRLVIFPVASSIARLNKEIKEKEADILMDKRVLLMKDKILSESSKYASMFEPVKSEEEENTLLLKEIENLANKASVYLIDIKPGGIKQAGLSDKFMISLNCEAQMEQLVDFMYMIENSPRLLIIEKFQIGRKSSESSVARATMTISRMVMAEKKEKEREGV